MIKSSTLSYLITNTFDEISVLTFREYSKKLFRVAISYTWEQVVIAKLVKLFLRKDAFTFRQKFSVLTETTISHKISKTNSSFHVKQRTTGKVLLLFFGAFLLVLAKFSFWQG